MRITEERFEFAPMGAVLAPRKGHVVVDVGSTCVPGVIDHHFAGVGEECAATLVAKRGEELVLEHVRQAPGGDLVIVVHSKPDLDCVVSAYLVHCLVRNGRLPDGALALAEYARIIDAGLPPPDGIGPSSLWALFAAAVHRLKTASDSDADERNRYRAWLFRGFELVDLALAGTPASFQEIRLPGDVAGWEGEQAFLREDNVRYAADRQGTEKLTIRLPGPGNREQTVAGLRVRDPQSALFKHYARAEGNILTHVIYSRRSEPGDRVMPERHVISVAPERDVWLRGLGKALEAEEVRERSRIGLLRDGPPRWPDVTNKDPWYDGRSRLHGFTIVDSPNEGTVLPVDRVSSILSDTAEWTLLGRPARQMLCPEGCRYPEPTGAAYCPQHADRLVPSLIDGRYEIERYIGGGAMGSVWLAVDPSTEQRYALKHLSPKLLANEDAWARFRREAWLAARLFHRNVVRVESFGTDAAAGLYTLSDYVDGISLQHELDTRPPGNTCPWPRAKSIVMQLCDALGAVHEAGVIHRDLKPANVMLEGQKTWSNDPNPVVKVLDFGIAILYDPDATRMTGPGRISGTPYYCAPEQVRDQPLDERTDIYAVGVMLYELLSGSLPFTASDLYQIVAKKITESAPPLAGRTDFPPGVVDLVSRLLATDPAARPATAKEVNDALLRM